jgi:hypothetical protein
MNHMLKTMVLSGALTLCATLFGCATASPADDPARAEASSSITTASGNECDAFCQSQGGPNYLFTFATSESACNQKGGDWYTADQGYTGPPPGCCCKCFSIGFCL